MRYNIEQQKRIVKQFVKDMLMPLPKEKYGRSLKFISWIKRDGSGVIDLRTADMSHVDDKLFCLTTLSIKNKTYIASEFNVYVVKLKYGK